MKIILEKNETLLSTLESMGSKVKTKNSEYFYIPGWFEKLKNGELQFHFIEKLPNELKDTINKTRKTKEK